MAYNFDSITTAVDGLDGLEKYKDFYEESLSYFDIVISDITMPKMNGVDMIIKMKEINPNQITVLITAYGTQKHLIEAIDLNIDKFIVKPFSSIEKLINPLIELSKGVNSFALMKEREYLLEQKNEIIDKNIYMTHSDLDGNIISISQAYLQFIEYKKEEVIGKNHSMFKKGTKNSLEIQSLWDTITQDREWSGRLQNHKSNGEIYWIDTTISPLYNKKNEKIGYSSISKDVTNTQRLKSLSITDHLTGIHNRRYFDYLLKKTLNHSTWKEEFFGLFVMDVDFFKDYNDYYGHQEGDNALKMISAEFKSFMGDSIEHVFRIGGEEFAIIMLNLTDTEIKIKANELVKRIEALKIEHKKSSVSEFLTISVGAVNVNSAKKTMTTDNLYKLADSNLYRAKESGRNSAVFAVNKRSKTRINDLDSISNSLSRQHLIFDISKIEKESMLILLHINKVNAIEDLYGTDAVNAVIYKKYKELNHIVSDNNAQLYTLNTQDFAILVKEKKYFEQYMALVKYTILANTYDDIYDEVEDSDKYLLSDFTIGISYGKQDIFSEADLALQDAIITNQSLIIANNDKTEHDIIESKLNRLIIYKKALHDDLIIPYFQPIIDVKDNSILKYEALARLVTHNNEVIAPHNFLDSVKEDNTMEFFTRQMLQKVFNVYGVRKTPISINVTYDNMCSPSTKSYIENRLIKYGGKGITFEIIESEDIKDYKLIEEFISLVKTYDCTISIDDFGSGYFNFTNIIKLNIDYIKLDGSLIENLEIDESIEYMVKALLVFAKNANIKTIAEFVSTAKIDKKVRELGFDYVQGYYYGEAKAPKDYQLI